MAELSLDEREFGAMEDEVVELLEERDSYNSNDAKVGLEVEYSVVKDNEAADQGIRDFVVDPDFAEEEFGAAIAEIETDPQNLEELDQLFGQLKKRENIVSERARQKEADLLRYGLNPFQKIEDFQHTRGDRYKNFSELLDRSRNGEVQDNFGRKGEVDPRDIGYSGMITSVQPNFQAEDTETAVDMANRLYVVAPQLIALTGNSRILEGEDTGFSDMRVPLWEKSADTRSEMGPEQEKRVGKLNSYFDDIGDYFERVAGSMHEIAPGDDDLEGAVKSFWKDVKIKYYDQDDSEAGKSIVVESRPFSTQPSALEDVSIAAYLSGRLEYSKRNEDMLDIDKVNRNRYTAMHSGIQIQNRSQPGMEGSQTKFYDIETGEMERSEENLYKELEKAREGLEKLDISEAETYLEPLYDRLENGMNPGDESAEKLYENIQSGMSPEAAMDQTFQQYRVEG